MIVSSVVLAVTLAIYLFYVVKTRFTFYFVLGNWKFDLVKIVSKYLYFENLDVVTTLTLDKCDDDTAACRAKGFKRLRQRLCVSDSDRVDAESSGIADCRFLKWKLANPLLKALRLKYPNVIEKRSGAYVELPSKKRMMYVSGDAVHFFDETFYEKLREDTIKDSDPRTPITINGDMLDHANTIRKWTDMDRVRYCLSGSEAVDAAFRVARVATGKQIIVRFAKAYHGHSSGVGIGGPNFVYLDAMSESALEYIETYHHKIAGVVINPMDRFTGVKNLSPPGEKMTWGKRMRHVPTHEEYGAWFRNVSRKCAYVTKYLSKVAFIVDDVYFGFRTPEIFSWKMYDASPDIVVLGKGIAGGLPLSVVAGTSKFMACRDRKWVAKPNKIVGTLSAWREGLRRSSLFLARFDKERVRHFVERCDRFVSDTNKTLCSKNLPIRLRNFSNTFTVDYLSESIYNSLFPLYLMSEDVFVSNQSTGKFNLSEDFSDHDLSLLSKKFVSAAHQMNEDRFFEGSTKDVRWGYLLMHFARGYLGVRYRQIMKDKHVDIDVSHNNPVNRWTHFWSSVVMLCTAYPLLLIRGDIIGACVTMLASQALRQIGHFFYERQDPDLEKMKYGHINSTKWATTFALLLTYIAYVMGFFGALSSDKLLPIALLLCFTPHFAEICHFYGFVRGCDWIVKIITDPITDLFDFYDCAFIHPTEFLQHKWLEEKEKSKASSYLRVGLLQRIKKKN